MAQTSSKQLSVAKDAQLFKQLSTLLADISHPTKMLHFLSVFLTETEQSILAKRLAIFWLLQQGKSYQEIKSELHVSSATISSVAENSDALKKTPALTYLKRDSQLDEFISKLFSV